MDTADTGLSQTDSSETWPQLAYDAQNSGRAPGNTPPRPRAQARWRFEPDVSSDPKPVRGAPVVGENLVYIGDSTGTLHAIDRTEGSVAWQFTVDQEDNVLGPGAALGTEALYVSFPGGWLVAFDPQTGEELWRFETPTQDVSWPPTIVADRVLYGTYNGIFGLDAATGEQLWRNHTPIVASPVGVGEGKVFVGDSLEQRLIPLDVNTGTRLWTFGADEPIFSPPSIADGTVYIGSYDYNLYALDAGDGSLIWATDTGGKVRGSPAITEQRVLATSVNKQIYALDRENGEELWHVDTNSTVSAGPSVVGETAVVPDHAGTVFALSVTDGSERWQMNAGESAINFPAAVVDETAFVGTNAAVVALKSAPRPTPTATRTETSTQESMTSTSAGPARTTDTATTSNPDSMTPHTTTTTSASRSGNGFLTTVLGAGVVLLLAFIAALWRRLRGEEDSP